ncbi:MAG: hypothetical protein GY699_21810, partial [Desulfobacteraceae bacterium]|nr:hypothetical protein [Desulfobacteraceae bacterium]
MAQKTDQNGSETAQPHPAGYPPPYGYIPQKDEINLIDLWNTLVKRKFTILWVATISTVCALLYALLAPSIYKAEVVFMPPSNSDIQALNIQGVQKVMIGSTNTDLDVNLQEFSKQVAHEINNQIAQGIS